VQNVRNGHIYIDVIKQHIAQIAYFLRKSPKTDFRLLAMPKSFFAILLENQHFRVYFAS
jgi:hypothetical protein